MRAPPCRLQRVGILAKPARPHYSRFHNSRAGGCIRRIAPRAGGVSPRCGRPPAVDERLSRVGVGGNVECLPHRGFTPPALGRVPSRDRKEPAHLRRKAPCQRAAVVSRGEPRKPRPGGRCHPARDGLRCLTPCRLRWAISRSGLCSAWLVLAASDVNKYPYVSLSPQRGLAWRAERRPSWGATLRRCGMARQPLVRFAWVWTHRGRRGPCAGLRKGTKSRSQWLAWRHAGWAGNRLGHLGKRPLRHACPP